MSPFRRHSSTRAFTLIELLSVIAVIAILAAILIPTVGSVRVSANKAKTRAQFSQWATAMELFRQEYGYYPALDRDGDRLLDTDRFVVALTGRNLDGSTPTDLLGNRKRITFYRLSAGELDLTGARLVDAFGNTAIAVLVDRNGDGRIGDANAPASETPVAVRAIDSGLEFVPEIPEGGIRAGVGFYSAGPGRRADDLVTSW
jgi:prepilin-type N-terminal cleavage/methylation domain-containing protein